MELCVIPGDGIGKEVIPSAVRVLQAVMPDIQIHHANAGFDCLKTTGTPLPDETLKLAARCRAVLFGASDSPSFPVEGYYSPIIQLRRRLDTYASMRPTRYLPVPTARAGVDLIVFRENTEDLYIVDEQTDPTGQSSTASKVITRNATERVTHRAYQLARQANRKKITIVHKANVLPQSDGLFRRVALEVAAQYSDIQTDELLVDTAAYWMVKEPTRFDMILTSNMYGDILSDMAAAWGGGLGMIPTLNIGDNAAIAEPVHGAAPDIAGKNIANPTAAILSVALLLRYHWKREEQAQQIEDAVQKTFEQGYHTVDVKKENAVSTDTFTDQVIAALS
ncbi:MAG: isocitrate dehydrogenase [Phototrophicales bacterium]|nr:MAG: isocitrate dehydrogenase [Phototrophicales bacterium]RMG74108.1 MAG: isocitrate/isopropylmalate dehydrogenase family protein [Chloroflexota bacterium]